ncbi:MAG: GFA family protein [Acetobacteraceae bacterium]|nr:GFA family protein [Acetobacteraceae bacterium]
MTERVASCSCGQLRATCEGAPLRVSICHCLECQKRTGSVFAVQSRFPRDRVRVEGRSAQWTRAGDSGGSATFHFCPICSAIVYWEPADALDLVYVAVGAFADPSFPAPRVSVYEERAHPWTLAAGELPMERHL